MLSDDRLPMILVVLDGLGDRPSAQLGGRTPSEAAETPVLDALAGRGMSGLHVPFGPGRATSSERAHWSLFGFETLPFVGRAALEALGVGLRPPSGVPLFHLALRTGEVRDGALWCVGRPGPQDAEDAAALFDALGGRTVEGVRFELLPLRTGECVLVAHGARSHEVSDSDPLFDLIHPWMRPLPLPESADPQAAGATASALQAWLGASQRILAGHEANRRRHAAGLPALDVPTTKWASSIDPQLPSFAEQVGVPGGAVTSSALYRGLARLLGMREVDQRYDPADPAADMAARLAHAGRLLESCRFVHVHVKATDEAGHTKRPEHKREVIEQLDRGLRGLHELAQRAIVAVTGDHATPSVTSLLHSGDPTPCVVAGPGITPDGVRRFGERHAASGLLGRLAARDVLPLLAGLSNQPFFLGHRPGARATVAMPASPEPMPLDRFEEP